MTREWRFPNPATPPGSAAYYSIRFAPAELRDDLARLTAWYHELHRIPQEVSDQVVARRKLEWWRAELERAVTAIPQHPLGRELGPLIARHRLPLAPFIGIAERVEAEIHRQIPASQGALQAAEEADWGGLFELMARCHGLTDLDQLARARRLGGFCGQVYRLRDAGLRARKGLPVLGQEQLAAAGLTLAGLAGQSQRAQLPGLLASQAEETRAYRAQFVAADLPVSLRIRGRLAEALFRELGAVDYAVADVRIGLTPLNKLWQAWRESRRRTAAPKP